MLIPILYYKLHSPRKGLIHRFVKGFKVFDNLKDAEIFLNEYNDIDVDNYYYAEKVSSDRLYHLIQYIIENYANIEVSEPQIKDYYIEYNLAFQNNLLTLKYYNTGKLVVDGKRSNLSQLFLTILNAHGLLGENSRPILLAIYCRILNICPAKDESRFDDLYKENLPTIYNKPINQYIKRLVEQSIINLEKEESQDDKEFSMYVIPACKALEGVIKSNFETCNIPYLDRNHFYQFRKANDDTYYLRSSFRNSLSKIQIDAIEDCYNFWSSRRNPISHFGDLVKDDSDASMIYTMQEAKGYIKEILGIIDKNLL